MAAYLTRFCLGLLPAVRHEYGCKKKYDRAKEIPSDDLLVRKILGENSGCRVNHTALDGDEDASATSSLLGYSVVHMTEAAFSTDEGTKAHELCHIRYHDGVTGKLLSGLTAASVSSALRKWIRPSKYFALRVVQSFLKESFSLGLFLGVYIAYSRYFEKRADLIGFSYCSKEGQRRFIQSFRPTMFTEEMQAESLDDCFKLLEKLTQLEKQLEQYTQSEIEQNNETYKRLEMEIVITKLHIKLSEEIAKEDPPKYLFGIPYSGTADNGDNLHDWFHPRQSERIAYLSKRYREIHGEDPFPIALKNPGK